MSEPDHGHSSVNDSKKSIKKACFLEGKQAFRIFPEKIKSGSAVPSAARLSFQ